MDESGLENVPLNEGDSVQVNLKQPASSKETSRKGKLLRQSSLSDGETAVKAKPNDKHDNKSCRADSLDVQENIETEEDKARLIDQVLALQSTLDDLSQRVDAVKDENLKLKSENQVLGQYIENLMAASNVFQATGDDKGRRAFGYKYMCLQRVQIFWYSAGESGGQEEVKNVHEQREKEKRRSYERKAIELLNLMNYEKLAHVQMK
eukprot:gene7429-8251_t